jgi:hypothetical protein
MTQQPTTETTEPVEPEVVGEPTKGKSDETVNPEDIPF